MRVDEGWVEEYKRRGTKGGVGKGSREGEGQSKRRGRKERVGERMHKSFIVRTLSTRTS